MKARYRREKENHDVAGKERGDKFHKHCMKKTRSHPTVSEEVLIAVFGGESSLCTFWRVRGNGYQHSEHTGRLPPSPEPSDILTALCPQVTHWEGGTCLREGANTTTFGKARGVCSALPMPRHSCQDLCIAGVWNHQGGDSPPLQGDIWEGPVPVPQQRERPPDPLPPQGISVIASRRPDMSGARGKAKGASNGEEGNTHPCGCAGA